MARWRSGLTHQPFTLAFTSSNLVRVTKENGKLMLAVFIFRYSLLTKTYRSIFEEKSKIVKKKNCNIAFPRQSQEIYPSPWFRFYLKCKTIGFCNWLNAKYLLNRFRIIIFISNIDKKSMIWYFIVTNWNFIFELENQAKRTLMLSLCRLQWLFISWFAEIVNEVNTMQR